MKLLIKFWVYFVAFVLIDVGMSYSEDSEDEYRR
jgi:hypothetical protein